MSKAAKEHVGRVKSLPCALCGAHAPSDAHHILEGRIQGRRSSDWVTIPLCKSCHQDPRNVRRVIERAGWNFHEAVTATGIHHARVNGAIYGTCNLTESEWRLLLREAGRRKFDYQ
jgi:hypothetical protein